MILIEEKRTNKVPGITSLFISFEYDKQLVDLVKQSGIAVYDKKTKTWEVPSTSLSFLIDSFSKIDSVHLKLFPEKQVKEKIFDLGNLKTKPYEYQVQGIQYGLNHCNWLLLDEPGLGKSLQAIYIAQKLKELGKVNKCLIVCGVNTLKTNWKNEIERHSNLSCRILGQRTNSKGQMVIGSIPDRVEQLKNGIGEFFTITNIETLRSDDVVKAIDKIKFDMIIVDEIHVCKNNQSLQGKNLLKLKAKYKLGMTGTLLLNDPLDCYMPLKWIEKENSSLTNFKYYYCNFGGPFNNIPIGYKNLDTLKEQIQKCSLRRTKDLLDLPEKTVINELVDMNESHKKFYEEIKNGIVSQVDKVKISTVNLLAMVSRLRQATVLPSILTSIDINPSKIDRCIELVNQIISNNNKVIIFNTYKDSCYYLYNILNKYNYNPLLCTGDQKDYEIDQRKKLFQEDNSYKVLIATWQKMGTGHTLTAACYAIFLDTPWTAGVYEQAQDRIHRIGSSQPVFIYNLICKDTIDERVRDIVSSKSALSNYVVDNDTSDEVINSLRDYIEELQ